MPVELTVELHITLLIIIWIITLIFITLTANELTLLIGILIYVTSFPFFYIEYQNRYGNEIQNSNFIPIDWFLFNITALLFFVCIFFAIIELIYNFILS
jgi:hypothetical protein